jgi:hypothetical protein
LSFSANGDAKSWCFLASTALPAIDSGMEGGMQDAFDLLEKVAVSLR